MIEAKPGKKEARMSLSDQATRLCDALEAVNTLGPAATEVLATIYHEDVVFRDPVQQVRGRAKVLAAVARYAKGARKLQLLIDRSRVSASADHLYAPWTSIFAGKFGPTVYCDGVSQLILRDGRVIYHRDYFDVLGTAVGAFPRVVAAYQFLLRQFTSEAPP
jgi:hypothetical protein